MTEPKYVAETLAWCNAQRKERGKRPLKKLPEGVVSDETSCPCGAATGLWVYENYCYDPRRNEQLSIPRGVSRFVAAFDAGRLPQYEVKS